MMNFCTLFDSQEDMKERIEKALRLHRSVDVYKRQDTEDVFKRPLTIMKQDIMKQLMK